MDSHRHRSDEARASLSAPRRVGAAALRPRDRGLPVDALRSSRPHAHARRDAPRWRSDTRRVLAPTGRCDRLRALVGPARNGAHRSPRAHRAGGAHPLRPESDLKLAAAPSMIHACPPRSPASPPCAPLLARSRLPASCGGRWRVPASGSRSPRVASPTGELHKAPTPARPSTCGRARARETVSPAGAVCCAGLEPPRERPAVVPPACDSPLYASTPARPLPAFRAEKRRR